MGKKEPYLEAIMLNAAPAQIARKQSNTARGEQLAASEIGSATIF